jgi:hypothetical protein
MTGFPWVLSDTQGGYPLGVYLLSLDLILHRLGVETGVDLQIQASREVIVNDRGD